MAVSDKDVIISKESLNEEAEWRDVKLTCFLQQRWAKSQLSHPLSWPHPGQEKGKTRLVIQYNSKLQGYRLIYPGEMIHTSWETEEPVGLLVTPEFGC